MSIKYAILGLLSWKPSTGYEIKKVVEESSSMYWSGNNNQIYKALLHLQDEGFLTSKTEHREGLPLRKIYTITAEGVSELKKWVLSSPEAPAFKKPFLIQLAWSDLLENNELFDMLKRYENEIKIQLILHQVKSRRGTISPARTQQEKYLWDMINENIRSSYRNELEWVKNLRRRLFENELCEECNETDYRVVQSGEVREAKYIEVFSCVAPIRSEQDALNLVALCGEHETNLLMLHSEAIPDDFFQLKTGVAGKVMQKLNNCCIRVAAVVPGERFVKGKIKDMVKEANRGNRFGVFSDKEEAAKWLLRFYEE